MTHGAGRCPKCDRVSTSKRRVTAAIKRSGSLADKYPNLIKEIHPTKNGNLSPKYLPPGSNKKVWWLCKYNHEWQASVVNRTGRESGCPYCSNQTSRIEIHIFCELKTIFPATENRKRILRREVDIYVPELNLGIEYAFQSLCPGHTQSTHCTHGASFPGTASKAGSELCQWARLT